MTPAQLAKSGSESAHQVALFAWASVAYNHGFKLAELWSNGGNAEVDQLTEPAIPELRWLHHIPNGGSRGDDLRTQQIRGGKLKAEGVRSGVSDISLPVRRGACSGLYIEMKRPAEKPKRDGARGGVSDEQREFGEFVLSQGFGFVVCYSWEEARDIIIAYLKS